ncbi:YlxR family protein [bacterium]|nr:YlxR family protein [bacterium]
MCLGCKERSPQDELVRLQLTGEGVVIIERPRMVRSGRSVYFCPKTGCLDMVLSRGGIIFKRAKYDKITVRLEPRQAKRLRFAFSHAARRLRGAMGVGPSE